MGLKTIWNKLFGPKEKVVPTTTTKLTDFGITMHTLMCAFVEDRLLIRESRITNSGGYKDVYKANLAFVYEMPSGVMYIMKNRYGGAGGADRHAITDPNDLKVLKQLEYDILERKNKNSV